MTASTPTEGIEPTIERIARKVCEEYLGHILGRAVGLPPPATKDDPTIEDHDPPWEGQYGPAMAGQAPEPITDELVATERAKVNAEWKGRGWPNADEECDAAVHQARVDALREVSRWCRDLARGTNIHGVADRIDEWAGRLEREQAETAGTKENAGADSTKGTATQNRELQDARVSEPSLRAAPGVRAHGVEVSTSGAEQGNGAVSGMQSVTPPEAKGAPEQMPPPIPEEAWIKWERMRTFDGEEGYSLELYGCERAGANRTKVICADIVERRVAEAVNVATAEMRAEHVELAIILGAKGVESMPETARRVVAERDEALNEARRRDRAAVEQEARAEAAEARVRELEGHTWGLKQTIDSLAKDGGAWKERTMTAESELARVRGELAEANQAIDTLHGDIERIKSRRARSTDATGG